MLGIFDALSVVAPTVSNAKQKQVIRAVQVRQRQVGEARTERLQSEAANFLRTNGVPEDVEPTSSGLKYERLCHGTGATL